jgi:hypothetical protein
MANHNLPTLTSTYANFVNEMDARMDDISIGFDPALTTVTNMATGTIRWVAASNKWQKWSGSSWNDLAATYAISISGNANTASSVNNALLTSNTGNGVSSGTSYNGSQATIISYNSVGAPSTIGTNATGTWEISITGGASYATSVVGGNVSGATGTFSGILTASAALRETRVTIPASNIDLALGNYFTRTISGTTILTVSNVPAGGTISSFILDLTNGGAHSITWWSNVRWVGGIAPALTPSGRDVLGFFTHDSGANWNGFLVGKDVK